MRFNLKQWFVGTWQIIKDYFYRIEFWRWQKRLDNKCKGCPFWIDSTCGKTKKEVEEQEKQIEQTEAEYFVKPKDVAKLLKMTVSTVQKHAKNGVIPAYRFRNHWLFRKDELTMWLATSKYICNVENQNNEKEVPPYESGN